MFRIIGAVIIVACTAIFGFDGVVRLRVRVKNIQNIITALEVMKNEICERLTPMPALMELLAGETEAPVNRIFQECREQLSELGTRSFYFMWKAAVEGAAGLELTEEEKKALADLGHVLGGYDTEEQRTALSYTIRRMEGFLKRAEEEKRSQSKVHAALGLASGIFAVIILL